MPTISKNSNNVRNLVTQCLARGASDPVRSEAPEIDTLVSPGNNPNHLNISFGLKNNQNRNDFSIIPHSYNLNSINRMSIINLNNPNRAAAHGAKVARDAMHVYRVWPSIYAY